MTTAAACAYFRDVDGAYAAYQSEIARATALAEARWYRTLRRAA